MPESAEATETVETPEKPSLKVRGAYLAIASPHEIAEACFAAPAVRALRHAMPQGTLVIVTPESLTAFWETLPEIDKIISYPDSTSARKVTALLRDSEIPFESSIAWQDTPAANAFLKLRIEQRLGPVLNDMAKLTNEPVEVIGKVGPIQHRVRDYMLFVEKLGATAFTPENFTPPARPEQPEKPRVVVVPGSDFGASAEWPLENFRTICQAIIENGSHDLYLVPSMRKSGLIHKLSQQLEGRFQVFEEDLADTLELLSTSKILIGNDGSVPHLAAHVGTRCVVIFGPNEPEWKRPLGRIHSTIREQVPCSPCLLSKCPLDHRCMESITIERVLAELEE